MTMKRFLSIGLLLLPFAAVADDDHHSDNTTGKTFFSVNPQYSTGRPEHVSFYHTDRMMARTDGIKGSFQAVVFGGQSTDPDGLARYFFPFQKTSLVIAEGPNPIPTPIAPPPPELGINDLFTGGSPAFKSDSYTLLAQNFNIETADHNFQSRITIRPKQTFVGGALNYRQSLEPHREDKGFWFDFTLPILHVKNSVNLEEKVTSSSDPLPGTSKNMRAAFMNPAWKYGKIAPCGRGKTGVADLEIRVGRDSLREAAVRYGGFFGVIVPTGNRPHARFLWEPIVGRNHHWGIIWGSQSTFDLWENESATSHIKLNLDINNNYLFEGDEHRSFDLRDKQWSRYINLYADSRATTTIPGINVLTQKMKIRPHGTYQINSGFEFDWGCHFMVEVGSQLYVRQTEGGRLACPWQEGPGIAGTSAAYGNTVLNFNLPPAVPATRTQSNATMHTWDYGMISDDFDQAQPFYTNQSNALHDAFIFKPIKFADLDLRSAFHPTCVGHTIYGTLGWQDMDACYPWVAALGGSYQFGTDNTVLQRWSLWGKFVLSI